MIVPTRPSARCRALLLELSHYLDGDLTPARRLTVERHIKACACCGTMAARLRRTVAACRAEGKRRLPRDVMTRAAERIRALVARGAPPPAAIAQRRRSASGPDRPLPNREAAVRKRSKVPVDSAVYQAELREDR